MQPKKIVGILYVAGSAGGLVTRILQSHKESYWDTEWINHDDSDIINPIEFPSNPIYFKKEDPDCNSLKPSYYIYSCHGMPHHGHWMLTPYINKFLKESTTHTLFYDALRDYNLLLKNISPIKDYLYIYASTSFYNNRYKKVFSKDKVNLNSRYGYIAQSLYAKRAKYTLNIENLLNIDYYVFEEEYNKLISYYNLTSRISGVRAFILAWIERQSLDPSRHINY